MSEAASPDAEIVDALSGGLRQGSDNADKAELAAFLDNPLTLVEELPAPFLHRYRVFRVMPRHLSRPILRHVAGGDGLTTIVLGADPTSLASLLGADGSTLESAESAQAYTELLLELIAPRPGLFRILSGVGDIPFSENPEGEDARAQASAVASLTARVAPPKAARTAGGWEVTLWVARDGVIQRETLEISTTGALVTHEVPETHPAPLVIVA